MPKRTITRRFVTLVAMAAVAPLLVYGYLSISSLRSGTRRSIIAGNLNVAQRAAEQIDLYVQTSFRVLRAIGAELAQTHLDTWQQDRVLKNAVLDFPEFRELTLFDGDGRVMASSRVGRPTVELPPAHAGCGAKPYIAPITLDDDALPTTTVALGIRGVASGGACLVSEFNLDELWRMVDRIKVGERGFALVVAPDGLLIAHGDPNAKRRIAMRETLHAHPLIGTGRREVAPESAEFAYEGGARVLAAAARIDQLGWTVIVEQPTSEAYAFANQLVRALVIAIGIALLITVTVGYLWGRSFIRPIVRLMRGTRALADGRLAERVRITAEDEFGQLGNAFNTMADRLVELQDDVRRQERQAMFGRIAVGLVHDLSHPIQNIGNSCKLILKMSDDRDYRETFKRTVERELATIKRVLEDLRNLARPIPLERFRVDVNRSVADVVESMRPQAEAAGVALEVRLADQPLVIVGDLFALGRVYRNLILNAMQATAPGGVIAVAIEAAGETLRVRVSDTGCGIPAERLGAIFEDFVTTKRRGLGLGLAISKKIVEQLDGTITVESTVGTGTTFVLEFPVAPGVPMAAAAS